jgi:DNA-binding MarR family transcriptional regulator
MHALSFALKRAHLRTLAMSRSLVLPLGLTPARFDLLYIVHKKAFPSGIAQGDLGRTLGLAGATISKMLKSLEKLRLVRREPRPSDRRVKLVFMTYEGRMRVRLVLRRVMRTGAVQRAFEGVFRLPRRPRFFALASCYADLRFLALCFGDGSKPPYTATCIGDRPPLVPWSMQAIKLRSPWLFRAPALDSDPDLGAEDDDEEDAADAS